MESNAEAPPLAALYCRISGRAQLENTSLENQEERLRKYAEGMGWGVFDVYVERAESGAKSSRPELNRLMDDAKAGRFQKALVLKLDRWSRSVPHLRASVDELSEWGIALVSVTETIDLSSPMGKAMLNIMGTFSELERDTIKQRTLDGRRFRATGGAWPGGNLPFGYALIDHPELGRKAGGRIPVHDPDEKATVDRMVELLLDHDKTTGEIATTLNAEGRPAKKGGRWTHQMVQRQLTTDAMVGRYVFARPDPRHGTGINVFQAQRDRRRVDKVKQRVEGAEVVVYRERRRGQNGAPIEVSLPPLVDEATYADILRKLSATSFGRRATPDRFYSLSGALWFPCEQQPAGTKAHGIWRDQGGPEGTRRMRCPNNKTTAAHPVKCDCPAILAEPLEEAVWQTVADLIADPAYLASLARERLERLADGPVVDLADVERRIDELETRMTVEVTKAMSIGLDETVLRRVVETMQEDLGVLRARRDELRASEGAQRVAEAATDRLAVVASAGRQALLDLPDRSRARVYALLDLKVRITDFGVPNGKVADRRAPTFELSGQLSHTLVETLLIVPNGVGNLASDHTPRPLPPLRRCLITRGLPSYPAQRTRWTRDSGPRCPIRGVAQPLPK